MRSVLLRKRYGPCFPGEKAGFSDDVADALVADGAAYELDKDGNAIVPADDPEAGSKKKSKRSAKKTAKGEALSDGDDDGNATVSVDADSMKFNPFVMDGVDVKVAEALAKAGIDAPADLLKWVEGGKSPSSINGVDEAAAGQLLQLYSA
jgi:hypothetical protein